MTHPAGSHRRPHQIVLDLAARRADRESLVPWAETLAVMTTLDRDRAGIGLVYD